MRVQTVNHFKNAVIVLVVGVGVSLRAAFLATGPDSLARVVPDDAFYYFQTASHMVAGHGSTFDGIYPTNGYHPLWMIFILPIAAFAREPLTFVRAALGLGILLSFLSALVLHALLKRMTDSRWIPLAGVYVYFLDPRTIASSLNGLETSLSTFLFVVLLYVTLVVDGTAISYEAILGLALGLLFLARTDNAFYIIAFFLAAIIRAAKSLRYRRGLVLASMMAVVTGPWLIWNWATFGSPLQDSASAVPYVLRESYLLDGHTPAQLLAHSAEMFLSFLAGPGLPHVLTAVAVVVAGLLYERYRRETVLDDRRMRRARLVVLSLWLAGTVLIFIHTFLRWHPREWYFDQLSLLSAVGLCLTLAALAATHTWPKVIRLLDPATPARHAFARTASVVVVMLVMAAPVVRGIELYMTGVFPHQTEMLDAAHWLRTHLAEDESAVAFNAGFLAFFSGRRVINLDGAINNAAYAAIRRKELGKFIDQSGANYYLDYDPVMLDLYAPFLGDSARPVEMSVVQEIGRPEVQWNNSDIRIYRLKGNQRP